MELTTLDFRPREMFGFWFEFNRHNASPPRLEREDRQAAYSLTGTPCHNHNSVA